MHNKLGKDVAAISVSLDDPGEEGTKEKVLKFLQKQKATFPNYILDEKPEVWQEKLDIAGPPLVYVFNRKGERVLKIAGGSYDEIQKVVEKVLKE
jgi:hypothetical protein